MRVSGITQYSANNLQSKNQVKFGQFLDIAGKFDDKAAEAAKKILKSNAGDYNTLNETHAVFISSSGSDVLTGRVNKAFFDGLSDRFKKKFSDLIPARKLENMQEGYKLGVVATKINRIEQEIYEEANPGAVQKVVAKKSYDSDEFNPNNRPFSFLR